ncbi:MAG: sigma-70 family RNA polymerase sigma factor [Acidobacteriota bacterium]|jgi:RNA polymerase sigma factor (sigma-70 family)|nr:sigma-70 family RNA polymerase sigma factor [Acidobacteriota bacterium]
MTTRPEPSSSEGFDSSVSEYISACEAPNGAWQHFPQECRRWNDEELSRIRCELRKLAAVRVLNVTDAEDIVQDTLLTLIRNCPKNELEKGPLVWSIGVLRNKIGNYYRKGRCRAKHEADGTELRQGLFQIRSAVSPDGDLLNGELRNVIAGTIESLPRPQKTAMKMLIAGLSPGEIAEKMRPERYQTVINHLHRGRKKLAQELTRCGFGGMRAMKRERREKKQWLVASD